MNQTLVISGLILLLGIIFYFLVSKGNRELRSINTAVHDEAKNKGLQIKSIISPGFNEWKNSPFEKDNTGSPGFAGNISSKKFYRVVSCLDPQSSSEKTMWVRVTRSTEKGGLILEWKDATKAN